MLPISAAPSKAPIRSGPGSISAPWLRDLAAVSLFAQAHYEHRWLPYRDRYPWRVVLAPRPWAAQLTEFSAPVAASLEPGFAYDGPPPLPVAHPRPKPTLDLPRIPQPKDIVPAKRILESDFKCSARGEDFPHLLAELARFAGLRLEVEPLAQVDDRENSYRVFATYKGAHRAITMENQKYANVAPFLEYLNELLAAEGKTPRLHSLRAASCSPRPMRQMRSRTRAM